MKLPFRSAASLVMLALVLAAAFAVPRAQAPATAPIHAVAYVEVAPASRTAAAAALKAYRDASRKDDGCTRLELFEQDGRPGHFAVLETWRDQQALDAHGAGANRKQLLNALDPIRLSDYDQRPYKNLSVGTPLAATNRQAIHVISHVDTAPAPGTAGTDGPGLLGRLADASRQEMGNLRFDVLQHAMRGNHFTVVETWANQAALDRHVASASTKQYRNAIAPLLGSPLDERIYRMLD